jgi:hypothetical protein
MVDIHVRCEVSSSLRLQRSFAKVIFLYSHYHYAPIFSIPRSSARSSTRVQEDNKKTYKFVKNDTLIGISKIKSTAFSILINL